MGASASREVRRILWLDTEGGIRGVPCWDISLVNETSQGIHMHRICCADGVSKRIQGRLRASVPVDLPNTHTLELRYALNGAMWELDSHQVTTRSVGEALEHYLSTFKPCIMAAWGMKSHDVRVLRSILPTGLLDTYTLVDPLVHFRKHLQLPKNSLAPSGPGTPRGVFDVKQSTSLGGVHTSAVDTLNMRQLCHRAFHILVKRGEMEPRKGETYEDDRLETLDSVLCILDQRAKLSSIQLDAGDVQVWAWALDDSLWEPRVLRKAQEARVKGRMRAQMRRMFPGGTMPGDLEGQLDAARNEEELLRCIVAVNQMPKRI